MALEKPIDALISRMDDKFKQDPVAENKVTLALKSIVRKMYADAVSQTSGYCMTLKVLESDISSLGESLGFNIENDIKDSFVRQWEVPPSTYMASNPYYHTLILLMLYGIRHNKPDWSENASHLILAKIWNGRRTRYIQYCNPDTMRYAVSNLSGKYLAKKYDSPISLIMNHFTPYLLKSYGDQMKRDSGMTKRFFSQCWGRIRQLFIQNMAPDLKTGQSKARSGLMPAYYDANKRGLKITKPKVSSQAGADDDMSQLEHYSSHDYEEIINGLTHYITINVRPSYDRQFLNFVNDVTTVNETSIQIILESLHNVKYHDFIKDVLQLMFKQLQIRDKMEVCVPNFIKEVIKKRLISSKHSPNITQLKEVIDLLLEQIFRDKFPYVQYSNYSLPRRGHIRKIVFYGMGYNMQRYLCNPK